MPTTANPSPEELAAAAEMFRSIKLTPDTSDIVLEGGRAVWITGLEAVAQAARCNLRLFLGEWFDDETQGMPYLQRILDKGGAEYAGPAVRACLLKTPGIAQVTSLSLTYDGATRSLTVDFEAVSDLGLLRDSVQVAQ